MTTRRKTAVLLLITLVACGGEEATQTPTTPAPPSAPAPAPAPVEEVDPPTPATPCETALDCHVVRDRCGAPYARSLGDTDIPPAPAVCPPVEYSRQDVRCDGGCELVDASAEFRECEASDECVALLGVCGAPAAVAVIEREAFETQRDELARRVRCARPPTLPEMRAVCIERLCTPRRVE